MGRAGTGARVEDFHPACDGLWYLYDESSGGGFVREMAPELSMRFTLPVELNSRELEARDSRERELLVYGSIPSW